jgi:hypothetical protein
MAFSSRTLKRGDENFDVAAQNKNDYSERRKENYSE